MATGATDKLMRGDIVIFCGPFVLSPSVYPFLLSFIVPHGMNLVPNCDHKVMN